MRARAIALVAIVIACGSAPIPFPPSDDIAVPDDAPFDNTLPPEAAADAPTGPKYNGGGPFTCGNCICDGTLDLCVTLPNVGDADASTDQCAIVDAGFGCTPIPIGCLPKPTCECLFQYYSSTACDCVVDDSGDGFFIPICAP